MTGAAVRKGLGYPLLSDVLTASGGGAVSGGREEGEWACCA